MSNIPHAGLLYDSLLVPKIRENASRVVAWGATRQGKTMLYTSQCTKSTYQRKERTWPGLPHALLLSEVAIPALWAEDPKAIIGKGKPLLVPRVIKRIIHPGAIHCIKPCPMYPDVVATTTDHKYVFMWNTILQPDRPLQADSDPNTPELILKGHRQEIGSSNALDFSSHALFVACGGRDGRLLIWKVSDYESTLSESIPISQQNSRVIDTLSKPSPKLKPARILKDKHKKPVKDCCFSPHNSAELLTAGEDGLLIKWDIRQSSETAAILVHNTNTELTAIDWNPDEENHIVLGGIDGTVKLFDIRKPGVVHVWRHSAPVTKVLWGEKSFFASASLDGTVGIWDPNSKKRLFRHVGHQGSHVIALDWKQGDFTLASVGVMESRGTTQIWRPSGYISGIS